MKITTLSVLFFLSSCIVIWWALRKFKQETMSLRSTFLWILMWAAIGIGSIFPSITDYFMGLAQMGNRMVFILLTAVFVLLILIFNLSSRLEKTQRDNMLMAQELTVLQYRVDSLESSNPSHNVKNNPETES